MLTRKQIEKIALKNRVSLFTQERDYVQAVFLSLLYSRTIGLIAASLDHIFAEKVWALLVRGMARDLYDLWFLLERGVKPDIELIDSKLALYDKSYSSKEMNERIAQLEKGWSKDLLPLLGVVIPYEVAAKRVVDGLMSVS
ncbi:MAG: hypothetical protein MPEBLZ_02172 [Candidatus Methanoperedens nitroreducens]|uniref:Uncharacterized protein n=1 Tax=Candidatus Methanoperedens nitratireducens TaxID=1392998 RepID=A0A0P8C8W4_9EURY|nr:nucleotidyl transferase AbiEii/AbiGii toxin family protein [Candidatus Methanoperedens sp. BLZ2]KAB2941873.1 MAG: nucleotidyl transferase AbiEii/AbiGii toxin family protein [Candidatus Methanoperedens sp.]KPQ43268.1 MAG: hypothetical protein MPEBLZ_02172 [Candidatus Methanoperedens sp. BLZ1]MBZ0175951.1 nucleotidyl transferase AbiEii/AbiGii toxin family protein [Candidatus Methanoperedens nitroreducens]MCX9078988.1 nucleotidyl transferase AbiEii/AbiGii toxin family protein [Candidatus Methan